MENDLRLDEVDTSLIEESSPRFRLLRRSSPAESPQTVASAAQSQSTTVSAAPQTRQPLFKQPARPRIASERPVLNLRDVSNRPPGRHRATGDPDRWLDKPPTAEELLARKPAQDGELVDPRSSQGVRGLLNHLPFCNIPAPLSELLVRKREYLIKRIQACYIGGQRVLTVGGLKGGTGKTTTAINLAVFLALARSSDRVLAMDANTDPGSLADIVPHDKMGYTIQEAFAHSEELGDFTVCRDRLSFSLEGGVALLRSAYDTDNADYGRMYGDREMKELVQSIRGSFNFIIPDLGTNLIQNLTQGVVSVSDLIIVVCLPNKSSCKRAQDTLDGIERERGLGFLQNNTLLVINNIEPEKRGSVEDIVRAFNFRDRVRKVCFIGQDSHIKANEDVATNSYDLATQVEYLELVLEALTAVSGSRGSILRDSAKEI